MAGPAGFFKGLGARVLYSMPATAICWSTYEFFKFILSRKSGENYRSSVSGGSTDSTKKSTVKCRSSTPSDTILDSANERYVIPKPPVIAGDIVIENNSILLHNSPSDSNISGSQFIPRELTAISGVGVYAAINMSPINVDRGYDSNIQR